MTPKLHDIQAITFDVGGTLIEPWPSVGQVYATVAEEHGVGDLSPDELNERFVSAWRKLGGHAESKEDWASIVDATFAGLASFPNPASFFESLYERFAEPRSWRVFEDVLPTLEALRVRGVRLGILSNWDDRLRPLLSRLGLAEPFEAVVISCEVRYRKPEPEIFQHAAQALSLPIGAVLHVGDSEEQDAVAARAAGMNAVGIDRSHDAARPSWIRSLTELLAHV